MPIGPLVHRPNGGFAEAWNKRHGALGPVFAGRSKSIVIGADESLSILIA